MRTFLGTYQASRNSDPIEASILVFDKLIQIGFRDISGNTLSEQWSIEKAIANFQPAQQSSIIKNGDSPDSFLAIPGNDAANHIQFLQGELKKPWFRKKNSSYLVRNFILFSSIILFLLAAYFLLVPLASEKLASRVPVKTEQRFGDAIFNGLGLESQVDTEASFALNHFFATMEVQTKYPIRITVVKSSIVNAFAIPGGRIVVYDSLLKKIESYPELAALLSHEFVHVNNKHATKSVFRRLGSKIFLAMLFGNLGAVTATLADQADNLKSMKYSRSLEKEADLQGLTLLLTRNIDPNGFRDLFVHLKNEADKTGQAEFLRSHPDINKRIRYIKENSKSATVVENLRLKTIFDSLKQNLKP